MLILYVFINRLYFIVHHPESFFEGDERFRNMKYKQTNNYILDGFDYFDAKNYILTLYS